MYHEQLLSLLKTFEDTYRGFGKLVNNCDLVVTHYNDERIIDLVIVYQLILDLVRPEYDIILRFLSPTNVCKAHSDKVFLALLHLIHLEVSSI